MSESSRRSWPICWLSVTTSMQRVDCQLARNVCVMEATDRIRSLKIRVQQLSIVHGVMPVCCTAGGFLASHGDTKALKNEKKIKSEASYPELTYAMRLWMRWKALSAGLLSFASSCWPPASSATSPSTAILTCLYLLGPRRYLLKRRSICIGKSRFHSIDARHYAKGDLTVKVIRAVRCCYAILRVLTEVIGVGLKLQCLGRRGDKRSGYALFPSISLRCGQCRES